MKNTKNNVKTKLAVCSSMMAMGLLGSAHAVQFDSESGQISASLSPRAWSLEYLTGTSDMHGGRIAYRPDIAYNIDIPLIGDTEIVFEGAFHFFDLHGSAKNEATYGLAITPVFQKQFSSEYLKYPFKLEFGIGVAYVHEEKFGGVDIGSDYQFEDRIGLMFQLDRNAQSKAGIRYIHYSNGGFNTKNPGLDFLSFVYMRSF